MDVAGMTKVRLELSSVRRVYKAWAGAGKVTSPMPAADCSRLHRPPSMLKSRVVLGERLAVYARDTCTALLSYLINK